MEQPLSAAATISGPARIAQEIARLRSEVSGLEATMPVTVVKTTDPTGANVMPAGTLWINKTDARIYVSAGAGTWVSADAQRRSAFVATAECTTSTAPVALSGPTITIYVPPSGIVGFWIDAELHGGTSGAGTFAGVLGVYDAADIPTAATMLQSLNTSYERRVAAAGNSFGASPPYGGWIVHRASPGFHTYRAAYWSAGGGVSVCFQNRRLWVATF